MPTTNRALRLPGDVTISNLPGLPVIALSIDEGSWTSAQECIALLCQAIPPCSIVLITAMPVKGLDISIPGYHQKVYKRDELLAANCVLIIPPNNLVTISDDKLRLVAQQEDLPFNVATDQLFHSLVAGKHNKAIAIQFISGTPASGALVAIAMAGGFSMTKQRNYRYSINENNFKEEDSAAGATYAVQQFIANRFQPITNSSAQVKSTFDEILRPIAEHQGQEDDNRQQSLSETVRLVKERYAYFSSAGFDAIWDWDLMLDTLYWGEGFKTLFGHNTSHRSNSSAGWKRFIHPEDAERVMESINGCIEGNDINWSAEYRFIKSEGDYAMVADRGMVIRNEQGKAIRMIGTIQDVTRKKQEEQQLKLFESVVTNINDGVLITGHTSIEGISPAVVYVNEAFSRMTGYSGEELVGKNINKLLGSKSSVKTLARLKKCIRENTPCEFEIISYKKNGDECWINFSIVPVRNNAQVVVYWIAIARDITNRRKQDVEKELFFSLLQALGKLELSFAWKIILKTIGEYAGFQYGEAWQVNFDQSDLLLNGRWKKDTLKELETIGYIKKIRKGESITGKAWQQQGVTFVNNLTNNDAYLSIQFAIDYGLNSAVFIPVLFNGQTIAMLSFYSTREAIDPNGFKSLFDTINQQLGPYVQSKKAEADLARFFDLSPDFLAIAGTDGYFKKINPAFSNILGYTREELFAKPIAFFTHPDDREVTQHKRESLKEGMPLTNFENRYLTRNGETRWFSWTSTPLAEEGLIYAVAKDTTEKKKLDEERKRLLESISDYFFALDTELNFSYLNSVTATLLGDAQHSLVGKNIWEAWPQLKDGIFSQSMQQSIALREPVAFEFYDATRDIWFEGSFYPSEDGLSVFFRSFNDRKHAEQALQEAFKEKDTILESIGDAFFAVDQQWTVTYWNKMAEQMLDTPRDQIVGKNLWDMFQEASKLPFYDHYQQAMEKKEAVHFEEYYPPLKIWLDISAYPSRDGLSVYFKDISERKEAAEAIRASNERYDLVAKATNDNIWDWDLETNQVTRPGKRLETVYGYPPQEAGDVDAFWSSHVHPDDWRSMNEKRNALLADPAQTFWEDEYRFLTPSGEYGFVYDKGYIIRDLHGKAIRIIGASQDITTEKKQVNEIIRIKQNLDSLINTTSDLIWSINTSLQIIAANAAYIGVIYNLTGHPIKEGDQVVYPSSDKAMQENCARLYQRALSGESFDIEDSFILPGTNGIQYTIISFSPIINKDGNISGVACFAKDITDLKTAGSKLLELNNSLEKRAAELAISNGELERFAYVASHDLQEPLRMVSSFMQLLQRKYNDQLDDTARKYIHFSVDGAERMKQLINDLLQYSRVGTSSLDITPVNMADVMEEVLLLFKNELHTIDAEINVGPMPVIEAGKSAMAQLMQNLVGNALKYRSIEKPIVNITARELPDAWEFMIKDNGIGIDEQYKEKIFIIFQRLHNKDQFNGTGIGLAICKKIIERYQGKIWVESEFGKGSKFIFAIPKRN